MQVIKNKCRDPLILAKLDPLITDMKQVKKLSLKRCRQWFRYNRAIEDREIERRAKKEAQLEAAQRSGEKKKNKREKKKSQSQKGETTQSK